jgi:hypothetical protein
MHPDQTAEADGTEAAGALLGPRYDSPRVHDLAVKHGYTPHTCAGRADQAEARAPDWGARRWVVEATCSWLNRNRRILIRRSKEDENHLALLQLACSLIAFKKAHLATTRPG